MLKGLGFSKVSEDKTKELLAEHDNDGNGKINWNEFVHMFGKLKL